jgi:ElaB/YqjD/DUF883 family membrane-anchored ribosome-binding protein
MNEMGGNPGSGQEHEQQKSGASATNRVREAASDVGQQVREAGSQVREAAREQYDRLRDQASDYYDRGREMAQEWEQDLEGYIQEQPIKSILIAAGVGLLLGVLLKRW